MDSRPRSICARRPFSRRDVGMVAPSMKKTHAPGKEYAWISGDQQQCRLRAVIHEQLSSRTAIVVAAQLKHVAYLVGVCVPWAVGAGG